MQKKSLICLGLLFINFVSAASFSFSNPFEIIGEENLILGAVFVIAFALIYYALSNVIKDKTTGESNKAIAGVISLASAVLVTYGMTTLNIDISNYLKLGLIFAVSFIPLNFILSKIIKNKTTGESNKAIAGVISIIASAGITYGVTNLDFDIEDFFFDIGLPTDIFTMILPLIIIGFIIFGIIKSKFIRKYFFFLLAGVFIILSFVAYEKLWMWVIAIILIVIGLFLKFKKKPNLKKNTSNHSSPKDNSRQAYQQESSERQYAEKMRQAQIQARAQDQRLQIEQEQRKQIAYQERKQIETREQQEKRRQIEQQRFQYEAKMRKGGETKRSGRYVSDKLAQRYAKRFGNAAAKERFKK